MRDNGYFSDGTQFRVIYKNGEWTVTTWEFDDSKPVVEFSGSYRECLEYANSTERS